MKVDNPRKISSYFKMEKKTLILVTVTGIIYNIGMTAGPYFEGRLAQRLYDVTNGNKSWISMLSLALTYLLVILVVQLARALKRYYVRRFGNNTGKNMRHMLYNSIINTSKEKLDNEQLGSIMTKAVSDVDACVEGMRKFTTEIFDTGIVLVAYGVMLLVYDWRLALLSCIFIPVAYFIAERCKKMVAEYNDRYKQSAGNLNNATMDMVGNALTYRVMGLEKNRSNRYENNLSEYEHCAIKANVWESALQPIYYVIAMCGAVLIFYFGSRNVTGSGWSTWDIGMFTTFFSCFTKLALKSSKAAKLFNAVQKAQVSWKRIQPMFRDYVDNSEALEKKNIGNIIFENTNIFYSEQDKILKNISFHAECGEIIGITGEIACGKSAFGKVFIGEALYNGHIYINGEELSFITDRSRSEFFSYMGHEPELMSTSILENITLGDNKGDINDCLNKSCLTEDISNMPDGINTMAGNGGVRLSGGQQSRVALARCMYHNKPVLILDDPFSAVDKKTEKILFQQLKAISKDKIIFIMSHRLSLFPEMDKILFISEGKTDFGTHNQLMQREEKYSRLYQTQGGISHE